MSTRFRALQHRNFQLFIGGQLISLIGTWMQTTAQLWLVYKMTGSAALLGVFGFANQVPILFLASVGGYVGDRYNRHFGVIATQAVSMLLAFVLAALTFAEAITVWELILVAFLVGIVNAFDVPIRQAFLVQMVVREDLPNAIALNSSIFNGARVVGPAIAGFALAWKGPAWCFLFNGLSFLAVLAALLAMRIQKMVVKRPGGLALPEFYSGIPLRHERFADTLRAVTDESPEPARPAVFRLPAHLCQRHSPSRCQGLWLVDERCGDRGRAWGPVFRRAHQLQRLGPLDRWDLVGLWSWLGTLLSFANVLGFRRDSSLRRIRRHRADGGY